MARQLGLVGRFDRRRAVAGRPVFRGFPLLPRKLIWYPKTHGYKLARVSDIVAYTDGGCRGNPGVGGWAFVLIDRASGHALERADATPDTTSNRMELQAVLEAFSALRRPRCSVLLLSDSKYVINCCSKWIPGWKRMGWKRKDGPLKNVDLLQRLDAALALHHIEWRWVPGHSGEIGNERVDQLVNEAMDRLLDRAAAPFELRRAWKGPLP